MTSEPMVERMTHYSRGHWSQIISRARQTEFKFDPKWKCLICGTAFKRCEHSAEENKEVLKEASLRAQSE